MPEQSKPIKSGRGGKRPGAGRKKGSKNVRGSLRDMISKALDDAGGNDYLLDQALNNPNAFMTLLGKLLPTQVEMTVIEQIANMGDDAIDYEIERLARETSAVPVAERAREPTQH